MTILSTGTWFPVRPRPLVTPKWIQDRRRVVASQDRWRRLSRSERLRHVRARAFLLSSRAWPTFDEVDEMLADTSAVVIEPATKIGYPEDLQAKLDRFEAKHRAKWRKEFMASFVPDEDLEEPEVRAKKEELARRIADGVKRAAAEKRRRAEEAERQRLRAEAERWTAAAKYPQQLTTLGISTTLARYRTLLDVGAYGTCRVCFRMLFNHQCPAKHLSEFPEGSFCELLTLTEHGVPALVHVHIYRMNTAARQSPTNGLEFYPCPDWAVVWTGYCYVNVRTVTTSIPAAAPNYF